MQHKMTGDYFHDLQDVAAKTLVDLLGNLGQVRVHPDHSFRILPEPLTRAREHC